MELSGAHSDNYNITDFTESRSGEDWEYTMSVTADTLGTYTFTDDAATPYNSEYEQWYGNESDNVTYFIETGATHAQTYAFYTSHEHLHGITWPHPDAFNSIEAEMEWESSVRIVNIR